jgi:hypothetical protein
VEELTNKMIVNGAKTEDKFEKLDLKIGKVDREMRQFKDALKINQETTPGFDGNSDNPVFHRKQLDNYMKLRHIPAAGRLTVAYRSFNAVLSRQWAETVSNHLGDYEAFKKGIS